MHKYDHHIGDYDRDTGHLTLLEHGVYRRLLDRYYADEELPSDIAQLERKLRATTPEEKAAVSQILTEFFKLKGKTYRHTRCDEEIADASTRTLKARYSQVVRWWKEKEWGEKPAYDTYAKNPEAYHCPITGHIRNPYDRITNVDSNNSLLPPSAFRLPPSAKSTPIPPEGADSASTQLPSTSTASNPPGSQKNKKGGDLHAAIYLAYPRREAKPTALRAIDKAITATGIDPTKLLQLTQLYAVKTAHKERCFIPLPATWFNQHRFNDDPANWELDAGNAQKKENGTAHDLQKVTGDSITQRPAPLDWPQRWPHLYPDLPVPASWAMIPDAVQLDLIRTRIPA